MTKPSHPLEGVRVLDLSQVLGGPFATRTLGDLGAEVVKIERPGSGDVSRQIGPHFLNGESAYFLNVNRNKKGVTLDLGNARGRETFYALAAVSDVVFDSFRPGVLPRLGLDYDALRRANPSIVACSLSGFGQDGPYRARPGFDGIIQALSGAMSVTGQPGQPPAFMGFPVADLVGGYVAALGMASALYARRATGEGRRIDVSLLDVQIALQGHLGQFFLVSGDVPGPIGASHHTNVPVGAYQASDGRYLQVHCASQAFHEKLMRLLDAEVDGVAGMAADPRFATQDGRIANRDDLDRILSEAFRGKTRAEWERLFEEWDIPGGPVNDIAEALADPQVRFRDMVVEVEHPTAGRYDTAGNPIKMGLDEVFDPPPTLGQHTAQVLEELLGYTAADVRMLRDAGAL